MRTRLHRIARFVLLASLPLAAGGCDSNVKAPILVPTGLRPAPAVGEGAVVGALVYDPIQAPDLASPPFPLSIVELWEGGEPMVTDTLDPGTRRFEFRGLNPGDYTVIGRANFFLRASFPPIRVVSGELDVGDLTLTIDASDNPSAVHVLYDEAAPPRTIPIGNARDTTGLMRASSAGLWTFPQSFSRPPVLAPGVHRMRFILNRARANPVNWNAAGTDTIDVPVSFRAVERIEGVGSDFWVRVAAPTQFAITLDLRRRTFSMAAVPVAFSTDTRSPAR